MFRTVIVILKSSALLQCSLSVHLQLASYPLLSSPLMLYETSHHASERLPACSPSAAPRSILPLQSLFHQFGSFRFIQRNFQLRLYGLPLRTVHANFLSFHTGTAVFWRQAGFSSCPVFTTVAAYPRGTYCCGVLNWRGLWLWQGDPWRRLIKTKDSMICSKLWTFSCRGDAEHCLLL
jgi:hypothetical protein